MRDEIQDDLDWLRPVLFLAGLTFVVAFVIGTTVGVARDRDRLIRQMESRTQSRQEQNGAGGLHCPRSPCDERARRRCSE